MMAPYQMYANDTNIDGFVDVVDVIAIINNILDS